MQIFSHRPKIAFVSNGLEKHVNLLGETGYEINDISFNVYTSKIREIRFDKPIFGDVSTLGL